ncbi:MAG: Peptidoglycan-binding domain 1 protein [Solirubrobacteraceae bacterium]|nr:Peptidoglycan-binding domain 1 protein [Solirubrobacteraceae bacterium]
MPLRRRLPLLVAGLLCLTGTAAARTPAPHLRDVRCVPVHQARCQSLPAATAGSQLLLRGQPLYRGMRVTFRWGKGALATSLQRTRIGWVVRVPAGAHVGRVNVYLRDRSGRRSNSHPVRVLPRPPTKTVPPPTTGTPVATGLPTAFQGGGMWIWYVDKSEGGSVAAIAARAHATGLSTVFVKSGDGTNAWAQFTPELVAELHAQGLKVCAWQYVYGKYPVSEARVAAASMTDGADCFVIDAESEYEGHYAAAQRYINELRSLVGEAFPIGLASFPYVDYHPSEPYSVFLGPGGAQVDVPQVYWKTIGGGVATVSAHTWISNRIYNVPVAPIGQSYDSPSAADITRFQQIWAGYGAGGHSWWSWQSTSDANWNDLAAPVPASTPPPDPGWPLLKLKAKGDQVIWMQEHLASADASVTIDGQFGSQTDAALRSFQAAHAIPATGETDAATWQALLALPVRSVDWTAASSRSLPRASAAHAPEIPPIGRG